MKDSAGTLKASFKRIARGLARSTLGRLPARASRLSGPLARDGGVPVRDVRIRPWANYHDGAGSAWFKSVGPQMRRIFTSGAEGLPQALQRDFASRWAAYCGCRYGLMLPHGTDALRLGLAALFDHDGLDYGGEVVVPNLSFVASATAALDRRFGVVFVDVDPGTLLLDPEQVEAAIDPTRTRAIMPVHQFGQPADMTALRRIAQRHGLKLIEDAAQAHGAAWESGPVGALGEFAAFSFQSAKNLTCGEGGILTTNDEALYQRADSLHNAGRAPGGGSRWQHLSLGWNCRATEYQAAILLHRFKSFEMQQQRRAENFSILRELLGSVGCVEPLAVHPGVRRHGMHMFVMRYRAEACGGLGLDDFLAAMQAEGAPIHRAYSSTLSAQPVMQRLLERRPEYVRALSTPVANKAVSEIVYIPQNVFLGTPTDMADLAAALGKVERHSRSSRHRLT